MIRIGIGLIASLGFLPCAAAADFRVLVSTDLGGDPDDIQSLYRLAHYSDILRVEAIVSSPGPGSTNSADKIRNWIKRIDIEAYVDRPISQEIARFGHQRRKAFVPKRVGGMH